MNLLTCYFYFKVYLEGHFEYYVDVLQWELEPQESLGEFIKCGAYIVETDTWQLHKFIAASITRWTIMPTVNISSRFATHILIPSIQRLGHDSRELSCVSTVVSHKMSDIRSLAMISDDHTSDTRPTIHGCYTTIVFVMISVGRWREKFYAKFTKYRWLHRHHGRWAKQTCFKVECWMCNEIDCWFSHRCVYA